jgi:hypothetical protein
MPTPCPYHDPVSPPYTPLTLSGSGETLLVMCVCLDVVGTLCKPEDGFWEESGAAPHSWLAITVARCRQLNRSVRQYINKEVLKCPPSPLAETNER